MSYKIAVASSDGKVINQHFGRSKDFLIFNVSGDDFEYLEKRKNIPPCEFGEHHEDAMNQTVSLLSDCRVVLVSQIGPGAQAALRSKGIQSYAVPGFIEEVIEKLIASPVFRK